MVRTLADLDAWGKYLARAQDLVLRVSGWGLSFRGWSLGFRVFALWGLVHGIRFRVWSPGCFGLKRFRHSGVWFRVWCWGRVM